MPIVLQPILFAAVGFHVLCSILPANYFPILSENLEPQPTAATLEPSLLAQGRAIDPNLYAFLQILKQFGSEYAAKLTAPELQLLVQRDRFNNPRQFEIRSMTAAGFLGFIQNQILKNIT